MVIISVVKGCARYIASLDAEGKKKYSYKVFHEGYTKKSQTKQNLKIKN